MSDLPPDPRAQFIALLEDSLRQQTFGKLVLAGYRGSEPALQRVTARELVLRGQRHLSLLYRHSTRDVTKNLPLRDGVATVAALLDPAAGHGVAHAHLETSDADIDLRSSRKGKSVLQRHAVALAGDAAPNGPAEPAAVAPTAASPRSPTAPGLPPASTQPHDRQKQRPLQLTDPCWQDLGLSDAQGRLVPAMSRKWRQINRFVEIFDAAWRDSPLAERPAGAAPVRVMDFGAGKGYLTFALHAHLRGALDQACEVRGVELRDDLVTLCNASAARWSLDGLHFVQGDVMHADTGPLDVMIALHACDTATDHALHKGIEAGAQIILCAPCCHKELRPQMAMPSVLRPMLQHGIHLGQQAEMITDSLRSTLLEAHGYRSQVFEFVSLEHTQKNKMILAVKRSAPPAADAARRALHAEIRAIKDFYGVREFCLERLLAGRDAGASGGADGAANGAAAAGDPATADTDRADADASPAR